MYNCVQQKMHQGCLGNFVQLVGSYFPAAVLRLIPTNFLSSKLGALQIFRDIFWASKKKRR